MYYKILFAERQNNDIRLVLLSQIGKKFERILSGIRPYCFVKKSAIDDILALGMTRPDEYVDEGFRDLYGNEVFTCYFNSLQKFYSFKNEHTNNRNVLQTDFQYIQSIFAKYGIGRMVKIFGLSGKKILYPNDFKKPDKEYIKFAPYKIAYFDTEFFHPDENISFEKLENGEGTLICAAINTKVFVLGKASFDEFEFLPLKRKIQVLQYDNEKTLMKNVLDELDKYHFIVAWNSRFDETALKNRVLRLNIPYRQTYQFLDIQEGFSVTLDFTTKYIKLKQVYDLIYRFRREKWKFLPPFFQDYFYLNIETGMPEINKNSDAYDYIAFRSRQSGANVHAFVLENRIDELAFYNACDVLDMMMIENISGVRNFLEQFDSLELLYANDSFVHTKKIEMTPFRLLMLNKIASPNNNYAAKHPEEKGAIVHEPVTGELLKNVIVFDFSKFYISIILATRVSPEHLDEYSNPQIRKLPNGETLERPMFFLESLAYYLIRARENAERKLQEAKTEEEKNHYRNQVLAYKRVTSGLWGYIASPKARYYASHVASQILAESRAKNLALKEYFETHVIAGSKWRVVYGDTDSSFAQPLDNVKIDNSFFKQVNDELNGFLVNLCKKQNYPQPITVKAEKLYAKLNLVSKKYYYALVYWKDGEFLEEPRYDIKGMQTIRGDNAQLARDFQMNFIQKHLTKNLDAALDYTKQFVKLIYEKLENPDHEFVQSISKPISFKKDYMKPDSNGKVVKTAYYYYMEAAKQWNEFIGNDPVLRIDKETKAYLLPVKRSSIKGLEHDKYIIYTDVTYLDLNCIKIDAHAIIKHIIIDKIKNILKPFGYTVKKIEREIFGHEQDGLNDFF